MPIRKIPFALSDETDPHYRRALAEVADSKARGGHVIDIGITTEAGHDVGVITVEEPLPKPDGTPNPGS